MKEAPMNWDVSDTPVEPAQRPSGRKPPPFPVKIKDASGRPVRLPGVTPGKPQIGRQQREAAPRARSATMPMANPDASPVRNAGDTQNPQLDPGERSFDVSVPGVGVYRVPGKDPREASSRLSQWLQDGGDADVGNKFYDAAAMHAVPSPTHTGMTGEASVGGGSLGGFQRPMNVADEDRQMTYEQRLKEEIRKMVREVVRKKEGGGGFVLYGPNKGKKKSPKPAGEFPTRLAAKRAELARFPPKDADQLKKARKRLDKLLKDPKKRQDAERKDLTGRKPVKKVGKAAGARKPRKEAFVQSLSRALTERLFHEDEVPGSAWDERIGSLHPDAVASDKKLANFHKGMEHASFGALGDAHKAMVKALRGMAKVNPGDVAHDPQRKKTFMPVMLDCDGTEIGPVHLYIDGGHVKVEISQDARQQISDMEPDQARDLRGGLMSFQEDHLPKIDRAKKAWDERDAYLDKIHGKLEKHVGGMSGVEAHLARQLLNKQRRR